MRNSHHSWMTWSLATAVAVGAALGCNNDENPDVPNRVLDRPNDVALACVEVTCEGTDGDGCQVLARPVADCQGESSACDVRDSPHLIGAVANSERNELAFFQQCSGTLSDLDPRTPGYQFVPTGALPSSVRPAAVSPESGADPSAVVAEPFSGRRWLAAPSWRLSARLSPGVARTPLGRM